MKHYPAGDSHRFLDSAMVSRHTKRRRRRFRLTAALLCVLLCVGAGVAGIHFYVGRAEGDRVLTPEQASALRDVDCILVLGSPVGSGGAIPPLLENRLRVGAALYNAQVAPVLLLSGDDGKDRSNETAAMRQYAVDAGVPSQDVYVDRAGYSTYESIYRAKQVFGARRVLIVTQGFHLPRALYIAQRLGLESWGTPSDLQDYGNASYLALREYAARCKDFVLCIFKAAPADTGERYSFLENTGDDTLPAESRA
ncbi:MAG: YdcF family protein [Oscillospiraceae bacterium]|jgi:vancomycin permeability regulator SanA|nr:YdcF family protein [Oscillospiraceae bacterium]